MNCVTVDPTPCGPTKMKLEPSQAYNWLLAVSHQKSPVVKPVGAVALISAPPVVLNLEPS